jgi:hypothetical protein
MAVKKSAGSKGSASKAKAGASVKKSAAKKAAPKKSASVAKKSAAPKSAVKKKAAAPIKLTSSQSELLKKVGSAAEPGYKFEKKAEQRTLDALHERKLIKRGSKDKASGSYHYQISNTGKKHIESQGGESAPPAAPTSGV